MFGFPEVSKKGPYGERLYFDSPNIFNRCLELKINRIIYDSWTGADGLMYHGAHSIIPSHSIASRRSQGNGKGNKVSLSSSDYEQREKQLFGMEIEEETDGKGTAAKETVTEISGAEPNNTSYCQVPVISRRKSYIKREQGISNYIYNPLPIRKKSKKKHVPPEAKDDAYWAQRVKNNIAARKSREERRRGEMEVVQKCESLLSENCKLRQENGFLQAKLKVMESCLCTKLGMTY